MLEDCIAAVEAATVRRDRLEAHIEAALPDWSLAPVVRALQALRGMALVAAATVIAPNSVTSPASANPRQLMAYLGLVPSEHSSGATRRQGGITKAGNSAARRMLIEAALELSIPGAHQPGATAAPGGSGEADPRHRVEGARTAMSALSQALPGRKITYSGHHRDRARTGGLCLGDRQTRSNR